MLIPTPNNAVPAPRNVVPAQAPGTTQAQATNLDRATSEQPYIEQDSTISVEIPCANINMRFEQPLQEKEHGLDVQTLELEAYTGQHKQIGHASISRDGQAGISPLIESFLNLEQAHPTKAVVSAEELEACLEPLQDKSYHIEGSLGTSGEEIVAHYRNGLRDQNTRHDGPKPRQYTKTINAEDNILLFSVEHSNSDFKNRIKKHLNIDKVECSSIDNFDLPRALVETYNDHMLIKLFELSPDPKRSDRFKAQAINLVVTKDTLVTWHESTSPFMQEFRCKVSQQLPTFSDPNMGTLLYTLLQDLLQHNQSVISDFHEKAHKLNAEMVEPLDQKTITTVVPSMENSAHRFVELVSSQEVLPALIDTFLTHHGIKAPDDAERIYNSLRTQVLSGIKNELLNEVTRIHQKHSALTEVRNSSLAKKIAIITAFTLPQIVASALVGPISLISSTSTAVHACGFALSAMLVWIAHKHKWMWP